MQNTSQPTPIEQLANFVFDLAPAHIPDVVTKQARLCILDTLGCMIAGSQTKEARALLEVEHASHGKGDSTVAGSSRRLSSDAAARVNAYMGDIFELNDLISGHASIG
ncbi:MAG: MmgE/PrpD family protein, partial [Pseudomonadales bacterium]